MQPMSSADSAARKVADPHNTAGATVSDWVDAFVGKRCSDVEFLRHLRERGRENSDVVWEALALLDQAFRCRRIDREAYFPIKSHLQQFALRHGGDLSPQRERPPEMIPTLAPTVEAMEAGAATASDSSAASPAPSTVRVGMVLRGRYRIIGVLGKSARGTVLEAIDELRADVPDITQRIAIRVFEPTDLKESGQMADYLRHVCRLQTLSHPSLLRVFDFDQDQGRPFLSMELLVGSKLPQVIARTGSPLRYQIDRHHVLECIASAIQYAHSKGVFHGALSAEEIFVTHTGEVRLMGLDGAFASTDNDAARDYLAFAWLVRDLLSGDARTDKLRRPERLTDPQWRTLEAVIHGNTGEGPRLLQLFAAPVRAAAGDGIYTVSYSPPEDIASRRVTGGRRLKWLAGLLVLGLVIGAGIIARDTTALSTMLTRLLPAIPAAEHASTSQAGKKKSSSATKASAKAGSAEGDIAEMTPSARRIAAQPPAPAPGARTSTLSLSRRSVQVESTQTVARLWVQRLGNIGKEATFMWWTEAGSAMPGADFSPVTPREARIPAGSSGVELFVPIGPSVTQEAPATFYVKIDEAGSGAQLGERTLTQVSIVPAGYVSPRGSPTSPK